jgi:hypothetical protein
VETTEVPALMTTLLALRMRSAHDERKPSAMMGLRRAMRNQGEP